MVIDLIANIKYVINEIIILLFLTYNTNYVTKGTNFKESKCRQLSIEYVYNYGCAI